MKFLWWKVSSFFLCVFLLPSLAMAQDETVATPSQVEDFGWEIYDGRIQIGFELELPMQRFLRLLPYIDLEQSGLLERMRIQLSVEDLDAYLDLEPSLIRFFPEDVRTQLTDGLRLELPRLVLQERGGLSKPSTSGLLGPDGKPFSTQIDHPDGLIFNDQSIRESRTNSSRSTIFDDSEWIQHGNILLRPQDEVEILRRRWRLLPVEVKESLVDVLRFHPLVQAQLLLNSLKLKEQVKFELKKSTPEHVLQLFQGLRWSRDGFAIEASSSTPHTHLEEFFQQRDGLLSLVHLEGKLQDRPEDTTLTTAIYHFHLSVPGSDLTRHANALNRLLLLRGLKAGYFPEIFDSAQQVRFKPEVREKGLLRIVDHSRIEFRFHPGPPEEDLKEYLHWLTMNADSAVAEIDVLTRGMIGPQEMTQLAAHAPEVLRYFFSPEEIRQVLSLEDLVAAAKENFTNITFLFPNTADLRSPPYDDDELFDMFYENQPRLISEYFSSAEIKSRLSPEQIKYILLTDPEVVEFVYTYEDLKPFLSNDVIDSIFLNGQRLVKKVFMPRQISLHLDRRLFEILLRENPLRLTVYLDREEIKKRLQDQDIAFLMQNNRSFLCSLIVSASYQEFLKHLLDEISKESELLADSLLRSFLTLKRDDFDGFAEFIQYEMARSHLRPAEHRLLSYLFTKFTRISATSDENDLCREVVRDLTES